MRTSKAFSTISYNTADFLERKLNELIRQGEIDFWAWIEHIPEEEETKKHKHLFMIPSRMYDTGKLIGYLQEIDHEKPLDKPLTCLAARPSKFSDWYLYGIHDKAYLASKGQSRKHQYQPDEFIVSDLDYMTDLRHRIDYSRIRTHKLMLEAAQKGLSFDSLVVTGLVPVNLVIQYSKAYECISKELSKRKTIRKVDEETGEKTKWLFLIS